MNWLFNRVSLNSSSPQNYEELDPYLYVYTKHPKAIMRLFCFTYAGGGASVFSTKWSSSMPESIEYVAIQLPGRQTRIKEEPLKKMDDIVNNITNSLTPYIDDLPYCFYGHSLGSLIAFEVTREMQRRRLSLPRHLYLSGRGGPNAPEPFEKRLSVECPDNEFAANCIDFFGPQPGLLDKRLFAITLPPLRADIAAYYSYKYDKNAHVTVPITVWGAHGDPLSQLSIIETWRSCTSSTFSRHMIRENDHHFLDKSSFKDSLSNCLLQELVRVKEDEVF